MVYKVKQKRTTRDLRKPVSYRGVYSRVAKQLGVSRQFVSQVAKGIRTTDRVQKAIRREIQRVEREVAA